MIEYWEEIWTHDTRIWKVIDDRHCSYWDRQGIWMGTNITYFKQYIDDWSKGQDRSKFRKLSDEDIFLEWL